MKCYLEVAVEDIVVGHAAGYVLLGKEVHEGEVEEQAKEDYGDVVNIPVEVDISEILKKESR